LLSVSKVNDSGEVVCLLVRGTLELFNVFLIKLFCWLCTLRVFIQI